MTAYRCAGRGFVLSAAVFLVIPALPAEWGDCPNPCPPTCAADLDADCTVGILDFLLLLGNWS